jgi:diacylglycerol kinase family enzyme
VEAFSAAEPDDGLLDLGVVTAKNPAEWARTLGRVALGMAEKSPFVEVTRGKRFRIRFGRRFPYELDGGARPAVRKVRIKVHPASIRICVPAKTVAGPSVLRPCTGGRRRRRSDSAESGHASRSGRLAG